MIEGTENKKIWATASTLQNWGSTGKQLSLSRNLRKKRKPYKS